MARRRFFVPHIRDGQAEIAGDDARHLTQVLRVEEGYIFELSDNQSLYLAEIQEVKKSRVQFRVLERLPDPAPEIPVHLLIALFKFDRLEMLLEKATELGVTSVQFLRAERSEKGLHMAAGKRMERWQRIVLEAAQQARRLRLPELHQPVLFREGLQITAGARHFLDEDRNGMPLLDGLSGTAESVALMVGPEGGWTPQEREAAQLAGWQSVSVGNLILRAETAAIAALAVVNAFLRR